MNRNWVVVILRDALVVGALILVSLYALNLVLTPNDDGEQHYTLPQDVKPTLDQDK